MTATADNVGLIVKFEHHTPQYMQFYI